MSIWLYMNILLFMLVLFTIDYPYSNLPLSIVLGLIGLFLILFNWTRHAVFSTIRNASSREKKIRLANLSKKIYPIHRWTGSAALLFIILHASSVINQYGFQISSLKMWSGILAVTCLFFMVLTGWLRLYLPSGRKRWAHIIIGFLLFFLVATHTLLF